MDDPTEPPTPRTRRAAIIVNTAAVVLTLALAVVCFGPGREFKYKATGQCYIDGRYRACPPEHALESRVYDVVIDSMYFAPFRGAQAQPDLVLLEARTSIGDPVDPAVLVRALDAAAPAEARPLLPGLVKELVRAGAERTPLGRLSTVGPRQRFLDSAAVERFFGPADSVGAPLLMGETVPRAGLLTLSRVAFDPSDRWALVWAARRDRRREGVGAYLLLHLDQQRWRQVASVPG